MLAVYGEREVYKPSVISINLFQFYRFRIIYFMRINAPQIIIHLLSRCHILQLQIFFWTANLLHLQESNASK